MKDKENGYGFKFRICTISVSYTHLEKENRAADLVQEEIVHEIKNGYCLKHAKPIMVILPIVVVFATLFGTLAPLGFPFAKVDGNAFRVALTMGYFFGAAVLMA